MTERQLIQLCRLSFEDIEMVRNWRNDPAISQYARSQSHISQEQQKEWFRNLSKMPNHYFVIRSNTEPVGMVWLTAFKDRSCESGIYIVSDLHRNGFLATSVTLFILGYAFNTIGVNQVNAWILKNNHRAIKFNEKLGYQRQATPTADDAFFYTINKYRYEQTDSDFGEFVRRSSNLIVTIDE